MIDANESRDGSTDRRANARYVHYDPGADATPSDTLVTAVADFANSDPLELQPLYETIDPDTLDEFVGGDELPDVGGTISFTYEDFEVTVYASGLLEIYPAD